MASAGQSEEGPNQSDNTTQSNKIWGIARAVARFRSVPVRTQNGSSGPKRKHRWSHWSFAKRDTHHTRGDQTSVEMDIEEQAAVSENRCNFSVDPDSMFFFYWLMLVTGAVLYNAWIPMGRFASGGLADGSRKARWWLIADLLVDIIYYVDMSIQARTVYMQDGLYVEDRRRLRSRYLKSKYFAYDILSILPVDYILLGFTGCMIPVTRLMRLFKVYRLRQFSFIIEVFCEYPNIFRVLTFVHNMMYLLYFATSVYLMFYNITWPSTSDSWLSFFQNISTTDNQQYIDALYWATITLTTIGDVEPSPQTLTQKILQIIGYLFGIFVFATIVGQVGSMIGQRNAERKEFDRQLDHAKKYMRAHDVSRVIQQRILQWYRYNWSSGKSIRKDDTDCFKILPAKIRTELDLHVNRKALQKVSFFTACEPEFLNDLVLRMERDVVGPGDWVCKKGELARKMFIISEGLLEVTGDDDSVLGTLKAGDYFGEIELLLMDGPKRITAGVRSLGYSELFMVTKEDILHVLEDYPNAKVELEERLRAYSCVHDLKKHCAPPKRRIANGSQGKQKSANKYKDRSKRSQSRSSATCDGNPDSPQKASWETIIAKMREKKALQCETEQLDDVNRDDGISNEDITRDVMASMEAILFEKLSEISKENNRLNARVKELEGKLDRSTKGPQEPNEGLPTSSEIEQMEFEEEAIDTHL